MKLVLLYEEPLKDKLMSAMDKKLFKKLADPLRPEKQQNAIKALPQRSGNTDTPLTPRLRRFFNSPTGGVGGKSGYGEVDDTESRRAKSIDDQEELKYPVDQTTQDKEIEKKARRVFGTQAVAGAKPRLKL